MPYRASHSACYKDLLLCGVFRSWALAFQQRLRLSIRFQGLTSARKLVKLPSLHILSTHPNVHQYRFRLLYLIGNFAICALARVIQGYQLISSSVLTLKALIDSPGDIQEWDGIADIIMKLLTLGSG